MKIIPIIAADMSGTLGGIVASHNRFGPYFRLHVIPVNPNTTRQQLVRALFTVMVNRWTSLLTPTEREAWNTYGANTPITDAIGNPIFLTGQNHYIRTNVPRVQSGSATINAAPTVFNTGEPVDRIQVTTLGTLDRLGITLAGDALSTTATITGTASDDGNVLLYLGRVQNLSRNFYKGPYQLAAVEAVASAASSVDFAQMFTALTNDNGDPLAGTNRPARLRISYDDGRLSAPFEIMSVVTAEAA